MDAIRADLAIMVQLDFIFARAGLALDMNAREPIFNTEKRIHLKQARQARSFPREKKPFPLTSVLEMIFDLLVVTGPNTGGKTVSLKTVGLLTMMGQAGLHSRPWTAPSFLFSVRFTQISGTSRASNSLSSTFSSHMTNVVSFLKKADQDSLVLLMSLALVPTRQKERHLPSRFVFPA